MAALGALGAELAVTPPAMGTANTGVALMRDVNHIPPAGEPPRRPPERRRPRPPRRENRADPEAAPSPAAHAADEEASPPRHEDVPHIDIHV